MRKQVVTMLKAEELLELVTPEIVIDIMAENGSKLYDRTIDSKTGQSLLWFRTICHGGDSHKLCFFTESKDFYCYTNCGRMTFYNFIKQIKDLKDNQFYEAVLDVAQKVGKEAFTNTDRIGIQDPDAPKEIREDINAMDKILECRAGNKKAVSISNYYNPNILKYFDENTFYQGWIDEGISIETMRKFGIRWYEFQKHIIIPHYNINGDLVGIRRRSLKPEDKDNKYMPEYLEGIMYDHPLGLNLYGLYENQKAIKKYKRAVIVEGEKSVLLSDTFYGNKSCAVATCGFNISDWQLNALLKLGVEEIYLGFDKDFDDRKINIYKKDEKTWKDYNRYVNRLQSLASRISPYCDVYLLKDTKGLLDLKDSPFDKGKSVYEKLVKAKKRITTESA